MIIETQLVEENVMNFFSPAKLTNGETIEAIDAKSIRKSPLAETLFDIGGINTILITPEMISITKEPTTSWEEIKAIILSEIMEYIATQKPTTFQETSSDENTIKQIQGLISARIRPAIQHDGGDIEFVKFENKIVYVKLKGNCVGCAYAMVTLKEGVEKLLKRYIPEVQEVKSIDKEIKQK
ncbi:MAG: NifU family protein [Alphaproteobacteria bacterium]|nr:NifU family protein [Alphaproteobacteria bacterium]